MKTILLTKPYRERKLYTFTCRLCSKKRSQSFRRRKAKERLCRKCRSSQKFVNPNQLSLVPTPELSLQLPTV